MHCDMGEQRVPAWMDADTKPNQTASKSAFWPKEYGAASE